MIQASIIIATFGDERWRKLAQERAYPSALAQGDYEVILHHDESDKIHIARNNAAAKASGERLVFLDGDDALEHGYCDVLLQSVGDLRYPRVRYVREGQDPDQAEAVKHPDTDPLKRNYMCIGTMLRKSLFEQVGGFDEWPAWEDWALWIKCWLAGARPVLCDRAIYRSYVNPQGRNIVQDHAKLRKRLIETYLPQAKALGLA